MNEKIKDFFRQNIGYFVVGFISIVYIATAFITIDETGKSVSQIIADGVVAFLLGVFINRVFDLQGMMSGEREEKVVATKKLHGEMVMKISPSIEKLDDWCEEENRKNYKVQRTKILARVGLKYDDCFDDNGVAKPYKVDQSRLNDKYLRKQELKRLAYYNKAVNLKLTALSAGELTSEGGKQQDPYYFGRTKAQYEANQSIMDIISKIGIAVIIGYYGVGLIEEFSYATLIWNTLQVGLFLVMGVIKMYQAYTFITDEFRGRIIKKIDNLQKFENYINTLPKEEVQVEKKTQEVQGGVDNGLCKTEV